MPTKTTVFNSTLGLLGQTLVDSDTDDTENTRVLNAHWNSVVDLSHEKTAWDFAKVRAKLGRLDAAPVFGYKYYYGVPADLLRILDLSQSGQIGDDLIAYEQEPGKIATNAETVYMTYVSDTSRSLVGRWSESFAYYVATELAARSMAKINPSAADLIMKERKKAASDAIGLDATQGPPKTRRPGAWARAARGSRFSSNREQN
jgi:hypothetical protein